MKEGHYKVFQYNGKDLFLQGADEYFVVLSFSEIAPQDREQLSRDVDEGIKGRELDLDALGKMTWHLTKNEIDAVCQRRMRIANLRRDIAAYESCEKLSEHGKAKLEQLREEISALEPTDPTAPTLAQQRSNLSVATPDYILWKRGE